MSGPIGIKVVQKRRPGSIMMVKKSVNGKDGIIMGNGISREIMNQVSKMGNGSCGMIMDRKSIWGSIKTGKRKVNG